MNAMTESAARGNYLRVKIGGQIFHHILWQIKKGQIMDDCLSDMSTGTLALA